VIANVTALAGAFRRHRLPVVLINVAGVPAGRTDRGPVHLHLMPEGWTELIDALGQQPGDITVTKHVWSAFSGTGLTGTLRDASVTQVVVTGIATSAGVESTARDAYGEGFHVSLPLDAMTDAVPGPHQHSAAHIFPGSPRPGRPPSSWNYWKAPGDNRASRDGVTQGPGLQRGVGRAPKTVLTEAQRRSPPNCRPYEPRYRQEPVT
jgi:hypothetical protein